MLYLYVHTLYTCAYVHVLLAADMQVHVYYHHTHVLCAHVHVHVYMWCTLYVHVARYSLEIQSGNDVFELSYRFVLEGELHPFNI